MIEHTVLIHSHNQASFIQSCLESVLEQSSPPEEIIVYDAGSSDGTCPLLRNFGERIRLVLGPPADPQPQIAEAQALQRGLAASRGEIIFILDGEDRFKPDKIERYTAAFKNYPDASVVQAPLDRIDATGAVVGLALEPRYHVTNHLREIYRRQDVNFFYPTSALAFSRPYLERILPLEFGDRLPLWTDARLCIPAAYYGRIVTLPDPLTEWRLHGPARAWGAQLGNLPIRQTFLRAQVFNAFCRRHHLRGISPWRNHRLYLQFVRYVMPSSAIEFYRRRVRPLLNDIG